METILLLSNQLKLSLAIDSAGNKNQFFVNNVSNSDNVVGYLNNTNVVAIIWDLAIEDKFKANIRYIKDIRKNYKGPIIALDQDQDLRHEAELFDQLVDDYICSPFDTDDIILRVRLRINLYAKYSSEDQPIQTKNIYKYGDFCVNLKHFQVSYQNRQIPLTPKEFYLMYYLIRHNNQVLSRERIYNGIWNEGNDQFDYISSRIVDIHISHLRDKLKRFTNGKTQIKTVRGFGYIFK